MSVRTRHPLRSTWLVSSPPGCPAGPCPPRHVPTVLWLTRHTATHDFAGALSAGLIKIDLRMWDLKVKRIAWDWLERQSVSTMADAPRTAAFITAPRLQSLTSARFFACMLVVVHHLDGAVVAVPGLHEFARIGYVGVSFFFTLSGFVLTWSAAPSVQKWSFWRNRFARIWPLWSLTVVLSLPISIYAGTNNMNSLGGLSQVIACLLLLQAWIPRQTWFFATNAVGWSLSAEAFFYALTPALNSFTIKRHGRFLLAILSTALGVQIVLLRMSPQIGLWAGYVVPLAGFPSFLAGHFLARAQRLRRVPKIRMRYAMSFAAISYGLGVHLVDKFVASGHGATFGAGLISLLLVPAWLMIIAGLAQVDLSAKPVMKCKVLVKLGEWSFALYLIHQLVIRLGLAMKLNMQSLSLARGILVAVGEILVSIMVAAVLHEGFEKPLEKRLRGPST